MRLSGEKLRTALKAVLTEAEGDADSAHDVAHADRVWQNAQRIACGNIDPPHLMAACYLHDLVSLPKNHPERHLSSRQSAEKARPVLAGFGFTTEECDQVCHAIEAHSFSADISCATDLAKTLQDADRLESLGAIGLARCFAVSGALQRPLMDAADPFAAQRPLDDQRFALDHFAIKLLRLPETMQTPAGRLLAQERADLLRRFLGDLADELGQSAPDW